MLETREAEGDVEAELVAGVYGCSFDADNNRVRGLNPDVGSFVLEVSATEFNEVVGGVKRIPVEPFAIGVMTDAGVIFGSKAAADFEEGEVFFGVRSYVD